MGSEQAAAGQVGGLFLALLLKTLSHLGYVLFTQCSRAEQMRDKRLRQGIGGHGVRLCHAYLKPSSSGFLG